MPAIGFNQINQTTNEGPCVPDITYSSLPNMHFFTSLDKNSLIGDSILQGVRYGGLSKTTPGLKLSTILFKSGEKLDFNVLPLKS